MELNKNKLIFWIVWLIFVVMIIFLVFMVNSWKNNDKTDTSTENTIKIWMVWEPFNASNFINSFKELHTAYKDKNITIEIFPGYEEYTETLASALLVWQWPDIFVLNNNDKSSIFLDQIVWVQSDIVNPSDFRKKYNWFFANDLIESYQDEKSVTKEHLIWVPVWYETLWVYYNRKFLKNTDLENLSAMNNVIADLKNKHVNIIPIGIWNWTTVYNSADIVTQFFMLSWANWISEVNWTSLKEWLSSYLSYWDINWINWYNSKFQELKPNKWNSLSLFSGWDVLMVVWYPSLIYRIKEAWWFSKDFLEVAPFPHYNNTTWKTLVNYHYFVINKDTPNMAFAQSFLWYLATDNWANNFLNNVPYLLPWLLSLEAERLEYKLDSGYNIVLGDFYKDTFDFSSFDKWLVSTYNKELELLLDYEEYPESFYNDFRDMILCKLKKITTFTNLWTSCE